MPTGTVASRRGSVDGRIACGMPTTRVHFTTPGCSVYRGDRAQQLSCLVHASTKSPCTVLSTVTCVAQVMQHHLRAQRSSSLTAQRADSMRKRLSTSRASFHPLMLTMTRRSPRWRVLVPCESRPRNHRWMCALHPAVARATAFTNMFQAFSWDRIKLQ